MKAELLKVESPVDLLKKRSNHKMGRLPEGFMEAVDIQKRERPVFSEPLHQALQDAIGVYRAVLQGESDQFEKQELSVEHRQEGEGHIAQLALLSARLKGFKEKPGAFRQTRQQVDHDEGRFIARLRLLSDPPFGEGRENGQVQLSFFSQIGSGENIEELIQSLSLSGKSAESVSEKLRTVLVRGRVQLNTILVYRNEHGRTEVLPQAGIQVSMDKDGLILVHGVKYVNGHPHLYEIDPPDSFTTETYSSLFRLAVALTGYNPAKK